MSPIITSPLVCAAGPWDSAIAGGVLGLDVVCVMVQDCERVDTIAQALQLGDALHLRAVNGPMGA